jgi:hypothetical protein
VVVKGNIVAKIYDPLYYPAIDELYKTKKDVVKDADKDYCCEATAYHELSSSSLQARSFRNITGPGLHFRPLVFRRDVVGEATHFGYVEIYENNSKLRRRAEIVPEFRRADDKVARMEIVM